MVCERSLAPLTCSYASLFRLQPALLFLFLAALHISVEWRSNCFCLYVVHFQKTVEKSTCVEFCFGRGNNRANLRVEFDEIRE